MKMSKALDFVFPVNFIATEQHFETALANINQTIKYKDNNYL